MKKALVQVKNLEEHICRAGNKIYLDGSIILTPGARDELNRRRIAIVNGPNPEQACVGVALCSHSAACACKSRQTEKPGKAELAGTDAEKLLFGLAAVLKSEYGVSDPEKLRELTLKALAVVKANL